jgi:Outer membrane protein beta-barrel domain
MRKLVLFLALAAPLAAQVQVRGTGGAAVFLDESFPGHAAVGASVRLPLKGRLGVEPEFLYLRESTVDQDHIVIPNLVFDFRPASRVDPYVIGGVGLIHRRTNLGVLRFSTTEATGAFGGGVKFFLTPRIFVAPETRLGTEPIFRLTVSFGYSFSR